MHQQAQQLRNATNPEDIEAVVAKFPHVSQIDPRRYFDPRWIMDKIPQTDLDRKLEALINRQTQTLASLQSGSDRYTDLLTRKLDALSDYDITISSSNQPLEALRCALMLKTAHISYDLSNLDALAQAIADTQNAILAARPQLAQMDLF